MGPEAPEWLFGYGSLIWRPNFDFVERRPAYIEGWVRRFWQGSTDHRGTPGRPGRVVTLVPEVGGRCTGVAFRLASERERRDSVLAALDVREQGGYARHVVDLRWLDADVIVKPETGRIERASQNDEPASALLYVADQHNPNFLGPASELEIARQVASSVGPSGANPEYVLELEAALAALEAEDPHVSAVAASLREILGQSEASAPS